MANKLKKLFMSSVDFVKRGANQDADIMLYKSIDGGPGTDDQLLMKSAEQIDTMIQKSENTMAYYAEVLCKSISSVLNDDSMTDVEAQEFMAKSLSEFDEAVKSDIISEFTYTNSKPSKTITNKESEEETMKSAKDIMAAIDKSALTGAEAIQLEALLNKGLKEEMEPGVAKSAGIVPPAIQAALDRMEALAKSAEMKEYETIAKKYAILGEDPETLAKSLYDMKQVSDDAYNQYVAALDKSVGVYERAGVFGEIGKSAHYGSNLGQNDPQAKINSIAKSYREKDPSMTEAESLAKAWEENPDIAVDYEKSYR